jgi:hypothetical protein
MKRRKGCAPSIIAALYVRVLSFHHMNQPHRGHFVHSLCHSLERTIRYTLGFDNVALRAFDKADDGLPIFSCHTKMIQRGVNVGDERRSD